MNHRIVVAGCGGMSNKWIENTAQRNNAAIVGLVDIIEANAQKMAERHGLSVPVFTDLSAAIAETGANLVFDVTIPSSHKHIVTAALKAGCHVFGEKPMAETMEDASQLLHMAEQTGKAYSVMQNRRYLRNIRSFRSIIADRIIGEPGSIHADFFLGPHFGGFREVMDSPLILDMAIHTFDQARFISGADPVSVYCHEYNPPGSWYQGNASAFCIFEMSDGSVFTYRGSWCAEGLNTSWESDWRVMGSLGSIRWDGTGLPMAEKVSEPGAPGFIRPLQNVQVEAAWEGREGHDGCLDEMFEALETGRLAETDCRDNIKSLAMVFGALESAKSGKKVRIGQDGLNPRIIS